jgi:glycosyltransferase involved in cell wall biosynthesis
MTKRVVQLLPAAHAGDATGGSALSLATALREVGYDAVVHALTIDEELRGTVLPIEELQPTSAGDLTLLHFAIPSPLSAGLLETEGNRGIVYHNLTPPEMLLSYCPEVAELTARGAVELRELASSGRVDVAIGVSDYNCAGLRAAGFDTTRTLPLALDLSQYNVEADPIVSALEADSPTTFLTVGRLAPNKRLETFVRAAAYYVAHIDPAAQFVVIGGNRGLEKYSDAVAELATELGLDGRLRWAGSVSHADLVAWYRRADVYLCTSDHEGFCAPLLEAMHFGVPILANHAAAIPETLGDAGMTFTDAEPAGLAEMMHLLATDSVTRQHLIDKGQARVADFAPERVMRRWLAVVDEMIGAP